MARLFRNASFATFLVSAVAVSTVPTRAFDCEAIFLYECHVVLYGNGYTYECVTESECHEFEACCEDYCYPQEGNDSCTDWGEWVVGACECS